MEKKLTREEALKMGMEAMKDEKVKPWFCLTPLLNSKNTEETEE